MVLEWFTAFWLYLIFGICIFLFFKLFVNKQLIKRYGEWRINTYRKEYLFSIPVGLKLLYIFISFYTVYFLWHNSQTIHWVVSKNSSKSKIGLFVHHFDLKNGVQIENEKKAEEVIVNDTEYEMIYEVVEYGAELAIHIQHINPNEKFNSRSFKKVIEPFAIYDCSRVGLEYLFEDVPPNEKKDEPDLPFGNRDDSVWNLYGWLRAKNVEYDTTQWQ